MSVSGTLVPHRSCRRGITTICIKRAPIVTPLPGIRPTVACVHRCHGSAEHVVSMLQACLGGHFSHSGHGMSGGPLLICGEQSRRGRPAGVGPDPSDRCKVSRERNGEAWARRPLELLSANSKGDWPVTWHTSSSSRSGRLVFTSLVTPTASRMERCTWGLLGLHRGVTHRLGLRGWAQLYVHKLHGGFAKIRGPGASTSWIVHMRRRMGSQQ